MSVWCMTTTPMSCGCHQSVSTTTYPCSLYYFHSNCPHSTATVVVFRKTAQLWSLWSILTGHSVTGCCFCNSTWLSQFSSNASSPIIIIRIGVAHTRKAPQYQNGFLEKFQTALAPLFFLKMTGESLKVRCDKRRAAATAAATATAAVAAAVAATTAATAAATAAATVAATATATATAKQQLQQQQKQQQQQQ